MSQSKYFGPTLAIGIVIAIIAIFMGGAGDENPPEWNLVLAIGVGLMGLSVLMQTNNTARILVGLTMLGYGIWWVFMPQIETDINSLTYALIIVGSVVLFFSLLTPPMAKKDQLDTKILMYFLIGAAILAGVVYYYCG